VGWVNARSVVLTPSSEIDGDTSGQCWGPGRGATIFRCEMKKASRKKRGRSKPRASRGVGAIISKMRRKLSGVLVVRDGDDIMREPFACCLKAAVAKCLDFNRVAHSKKHRQDEGNLLVSGLRGISEDLIVLRFLAQIPEKQRNEYLIALLQRNLSDGLAVQVKFFKANNSTQPVVGAGSSEDEIASRVKAARDSLIAASKGFRIHWCAVGSQHGSRCWFVGDLRFYIFSYVKFCTF
jgi:hypothetical protein